MKLIELLAGVVDDSLLQGNALDIKGVSLDSRNVASGFLFVAVSGALQHGLAFAEQAKDNGATAIIYDPAGSEIFDLASLGCCYFAIPQLALSLGGIAERFYHSPSKNLEVIGITGTNGKTSCSQFLLQLIPDSGVIGTLGWGVNEQLKQTENTTPDALAVQKMLAEFVALNKQTVIMEVSSHGLKQGRVNNVSFKGAVFTNLTRDHLDYHGSMAEYLQAKLVLFKQPGLAFVVVNADDKNSDLFLSAANKQVKRWAFSSSDNVTASAENVVADEVIFSLKGIEFTVCWRGEKQRVHTEIVGDFNLDNILTVITVLLAQGSSLQSAAKKVAKLQPVSGRMEKFGGHGQPYVFVDYAHTPDALQKVLLGLKKYHQQMLRLIFGCGGNRDRGKRAEMGLIAEALADWTIVTNDNPRFEEPQQIIEDIVRDCTVAKYDIILDRQLAIQTAIKQAAHNDCILIAGKGHENYQELKGVKQPFSDQIIVENALLAREC